MEDKAEEDHDSWVHVSKPGEFMADLLRGKMTS
jgi:hypothetical protein